MIALLGTLALGLAVGKLTRRLGPAVDLTLFLLVAGLVAAEFFSWSGRGGGGASDLLRELLAAFR